MNLSLTSPFLTPKGGYTSSKANFYANVIKNICETTASRLNSHVLVAKKLDQNGVISDYVQLTDVLSVDETFALATTEGKYYGVSAWLRSGIKAKEDLLNNIRYAPAALFVTMPLLATYVQGLKQAHTILIPSEESIDLVIDRLSIAERAEYLTLEAQAAHIGQRIHAKGALFNTWRNQIVNYKPIEFLTPSGQSTVTFILNNSLRMTIEQIDELLLRLQGEHRAVESKLNSYKARLKVMVQELIQERQAERQAAEQEYRAATLLYDADLKIATAKAEEERSKLLVEASKLGIAIPNMHKAILKEIEAKISYTEETGADTEVG